MLNKNVRDPDLARQFAANEENRMSWNSPPWRRRGGCAINEMSRSHLSWAQTGWFVQATVRIYSEVERTTPSAPFKRTGIFFDGASTPPLPRRGFFASYRFILNSSTETCWECVSKHLI